MPGIELAPDLLGDIMLRASSIDEKFVLAQVSQLWRNVALSTPLLWSSFTGGSSRADCYRIPLILERSGATAMLHIQFRFTSWNTDWPADALKALVPYVSRIETLDMVFRVPVNAEPLLGSNLQFPALRTLRLEGAEYTRTLFSLSAPRLQSLDVEHFQAKNWDTLLGSSMENIRLFKAGDAHIETLSAIIIQCPLAWRILFHSDLAWEPCPDDHAFQVFSRRPLAPALRELELRLAEDDLERVLKIGFSDVVLDTLTGSIYNGHGEDDIELLARTLLPGIGPLLCYENLDSQEIVLRDGDGYTRRLQCWNDDSGFEVRDVWQYFSIHYDLHKTVRQIRIMTQYWDDYLRIFELYPPQSQDGITLGIRIHEEWNDEADSVTATQVMRICGLAKVEFSSDRYFKLTLESILNFLARLEPSEGHKVEVCIGDELPPSFTAFRMSLSELPGNWVVCSHCLTARAS
ncbi:hypothetical protein FB451DRAFT_1224046 [Mycena latifolia]|nr:hypothetical protein FB451DRAFT_1224046 [Mycena latifolia]